MAEAQRIQSITFILSNIRDIKKILKQYRLYKDLFETNILTSQEIKEYINDLILLSTQLKQFLKDTNKIFDK